MKLVILLFLGSCVPLKRGPLVPMLGIGKDGQEIIKKVPLNAHSYYLAQLIEGTHDRFSKNLKIVPSNKAFELTRVDLNIIMTFGFSLGDLLGIDLSPSLRLQFSKVRSKG